MSKKALLILADGFEEAEAVVPADILRRAGITLTLCALAGREVMGSRGIKILTDITLDQIKEDYDALILPGGGDGAQNLSRSDKVSNLIKKMHKDRKIIAAICASPVVVLAPSGVLSGKKAVCYPGMEGDFPQDVTVVNQPVVTDGNIITANGPGAAFLFGFKLAEVLAGAAVADKVKKDMCFC
jgi:4-methyl-5(b-hydroxyethyl)-thiazole monophosphate biosynthesis